MKIKRCPNIRIRADLARPLARNLALQDERICRWEYEASLELSLCHRRSVIDLQRSSTLEAPLLQVARC